jgi:hypothetical protein
MPNTRIAVIPAYIYRILLNGFAHKKIFKGGLVSTRSGLKNSRLASIIGS